MAIKTNFKTRKIEIDGKKYLIQSSEGEIRRAALTHSKKYKELKPETMNDDALAEAVYEATVDTRNLIEVVLGKEVAKQLIDGKPASVNEMVGFASDIITEAIKAFEK